MVSNNVMITFLGEEFDREASHIPNGVCATLFTTSRTEAEQDWSLLADSIHKLGRGERGNIISYFKLAPGTGCLSVNNSTNF